MADVIREGTLAGMLSLMTIKELREFECYYGTKGGPKKSGKVEALLVLYRMRDAYDKRMMLDKISYAVQSVQKRKVDIVQKKEKKASDMVDFLTQLRKRLGMQRVFGSAFSISKKWISVKMGGNGPFKTRILSVGKNCIQTEFRNDSTYTNWVFTEIMASDCGSDKKKVMTAKFTAKQCKTYVIFVEIPTGVPTLKEMALTWVATNATPEEILALPYAVASEVSDYTEGMTKRVILKNLKSPSV